MRTASGNIRTLLAFIIGVAALALIKTIDDMKNGNSKYCGGHCEVCYCGKNEKVPQPNTASHGKR